MTKRKQLAIAGMMGVAALVAAIALWPRASKVEPEAAFELVAVGPTDVTIAWQTRDRSRASIRFQPSAGEGEATLVTEKPPATVKHRIELRGLEPATRYRYGLAGSELRHPFETQPAPATPFSFLLLWGEVPERLGELARSESAGFLLSLTPIPSADPDPYRDVRPSLALFGPTGPHSRVFEQPPQERWALDWGGLRLLLLRELGDFAALLDDGTPHTVGIILQRGGVGLERVGESDHHAAIARYNREHPARPVSFVLLPGATGEPVETEGVAYVGVPLERDGKPLAGGARIDVGPDSTVARLLDGGREITLRKPPLRRWRSCKECRELADRGAYEQSVRAYQEFIANNEGHYQIDDAHYAIAQLLDERLFRFVDALGWYEKLVEHYPESTLVALARQRMAFLSARADHQFEPLARFERIRKLELARHKQNPTERAKLLGQVQAIVDDFPDSALGPEIRYWLANQYRAAEPERAVTIYRELLSRHPNHPLASDARIEIGETYYDARRYRQAVAAYRDALAAEPARAGSIQPQIARSERNMRRGILAWASWALLALLVVPVAAWRPRGLSLPELRRGIVALFFLAPLTLFGGWLVHEQFTSRSELFGLALTAPLAACFGYPVTACLGRKLCRATKGDESTRRRLLAALVGALLGLVAVLCASYLGIYYLNEHYLPAFGL